MMVSDVIEMTVHTVLHRGVANEECIAIQVNQTLNLGQYGLMLGHYAGTNGAFPYRDNLFWFGDGIVQQGDWIFIYTGNGSPTQTYATDNIHKIYSLFWGKQNTVFANSNVVPILFRVDAVAVPLPPGDVPQLSN
ncbi:hypothetical protein [Shewanella algae]|uniref:hypothetical protein n=1 Tax=Shewanella algae TaxID=38313 RepID=UPI001AAD9A09|nr:hypothetical protein [Shewanella algae]MBO2629534.1 hypothetical protein [Shewanella algae]QTE93759.1 hypothetical protein JKK45_15010 [Shewanella algae]